MKALQVINNLDSGGAEKLLLDSMPLYSAKGVDVDVLVLQDRDYPFYKLLQKESVIDLKSLGRASVYSPTHVFKMMPLLSKYDIVHVHLFPAQYWVVIAKLLSFSKVKLIFTEHNTSNRRLQTPQIRYIEKIIYRFYSKIICITEEVKKELVKKLKIEEINSS